MAAANEMSPGRTVCESKDVLTSEAHPEERHITVVCEESRTVQVNTNTPDINSSKTDIEETEVQDENVSCVNEDDISKATSVMNALSLECKKETQTVVDSGAGAVVCDVAKGDQVTDVELQPPVQQVYRLKWMDWHGKRTPIVTQNENGPCPLIAIANILLLRGKIQLRNLMEFVTANELMEYIGDAIMESIPKDLKGARMLNYEQNMHDAIAVLPHLHTGLDVNVKFTGVQHFEYTPECIIFDLLNIPLYHGWLVDPQCCETVEALGSLGYNQLVERIIVNKCSSDCDLVTEALIAEQFLERTASQLTYHGLCELNSAMKQEELAVLFRNNHFSTILKKKSELFQLVTDQGFLHEPRVVWETLCNIEGDGQFVDSQFATVPPKSNDGFISQTPLTKDQQISTDFLVALSLQEEQKSQECEEAWKTTQQILVGPAETTDEELARRMQAEEEPAALAATPAAPGRAPSPTASIERQLTDTPTSMSAASGERSRKGVCIVI